MNTFFDKRTSNINTGTETNFGTVFKNKHPSDLAMQQLAKKLQKESIGTFYEKELQKTNQKELRIEKIIKEKVINYMLNQKVMIICLTVGLTKKMLIYKNK